MCMRKSKYMSIPKINNENGAPKEPTESHYCSGMDRYEDFFRLYIVADRHQ